MTSKQKLADLLYQYTCAWNKAKQDPRVEYNDGAFRELCRDLHGELSAWIEQSRPAPKKPEIRRVVRVEFREGEVDRLRAGWGG